MISRPTTEQLILECCRELMEDVLPHVSDETAQVRVVMIDTVLRNAAVRAGNEIAWMREEIADVIQYAHSVVSTVPDATPVADALAALQKAPDDSLLLADVANLYTQGGELLALAIEAVIANRATELIAAGEALIEARMGREHEVMAGWSPTGR